MRDPPLSVILSWPTPNYLHPETRAWAIILLISICMPIIIIIVLVRLYTRLRISRCFGLDDWMIIPSAITAIGYCICALYGIKHGWYKHIWDVPLPEVVKARKIVVASSLLGLLNVATTKLSILLVYRRIFPPSPTQTVVNILLFLTLAWMISMTITNFLLCIPLQAYWDVFYAGKQTCLFEVPYFVTFSGIDLLLDVAVYIVPLPALSKLRLPRRQKVILMGAFAFGILAIGAAALRLPSLVRASESYDMTWELYNAAFWTIVEACVGITCASVPALKSLVERYAPSFLSTSTSSKRGIVSYRSDVGKHGVTSTLRSGSLKDQSTVISKGFDDV